MTLNELRKKFSELMREAAAFADSTELKDVGSALVFAKEVEKSVDKDDESSITAVARKKVIEQVRLLGKQKPGEASTILIAGGWKFPIRPYRTGLDPKKVLARLIAKKKNPKQFMKEVPTYEIDPAGMEKAKKMKVFTEQELKEMQYDEVWTVTTPTEA